MATPVELVKEKLDIVEFLKGHLALTPAGKNFKGLCPFHREKTPSFMVSPERQTWHCFGCSLGGDVFSFVMRYENVEFGEALRLLAERTGVELKRVSPAEYKLTGILYDLNMAAKEFFKEQLRNAKTTAAYLKERGLKEETIEEFEIGWAPSDQEALTMHLLNKGHQPDDIVRAGLAIRNERGLHFDRFRGRIMFPIHNHLGKVVGFTGRILPSLDTGQMGKYVNSPETPIFNKSRILYGFFKSKEHIREKGWAFLVEGQMDFLMSWQSGIKNAVACSGTALTVDHLRTLRRLTDKLTLSFDTDEAGWQAGERAVDLAEANDFEVKVVILHRAKDPAEAAAADPAALRKAVENAEAAMKLYFERYLPASPKGANYADREHLRGLRAVLGKIKNIASPVEQSFWTKELAENTGLSEKVLADEAQRSENAPSAAPAVQLDAGPNSKEQRKISRWELLSQKALSHALRSGTFDELQEEQLYGDYPKVFRLLREGKRTSSDGALDELLNVVVLGEALVAEEDPVRVRDELLKEYVREKRKELTAQVKEAENRADEKALQEALQELHHLPHVP
jgi:DNA primase